MTDDAKTPQTVRELGIELSGFKDVTGVHLTNLNEKLEANNTHISKLTQTLDALIAGKVDQNDFDAHVTWGQAEIELLKIADTTVSDRVTILERDKRDRDRSFMTRLLVQIQDKSSHLLAAVLIAAFIYFIAKFSNIGLIN